ncbi:MAG: polyphosphate kinase 1 [Bacteroidales bacterium]
MTFEYVNRDISWLYFNYRVLQEAKDLSLPVYERIKFLAIYSNNLEEFYRVRVSYYRRLIRELPAGHPKIEKVNPTDVISKINELVSAFQNEFNEVFRNTIIPELEENNIRIIDINTSVTVSQDTFIRNVFEAHILPHIQPVLLEKKRIKPFMRTGQIYIVIKLYRKSNTSLTETSFVKRSAYGLVKLPTDHGVSRFVQIPLDEKGNHCIMFLEDVMMKYICDVYPGYIVDSWYSVKMTRDADLDYEDFDSKELIDIISNIAITRQLGLPNRFQYDSKMPKEMCEYIIDTFDIQNEDLVQAGKYHNFRDFFSFPNPISPKLETEQFRPMLHPVLQTTHSIIRQIEKTDVVLHFPYQSYSYFIKFLTEAAYDESVTEIKATQYRVADNSAVVKSLILAARNGKKVTVFVELKARFDEENNLRFAREMKHAGIQIIYSMPKLKVHAKVALVTRKNSKEKITQTAFLGTGNFNEKTAELYCDHGFFTGDKRITTELVELFNILERTISHYPFKHLLVPNNNMVDRFEELIRNEMVQAQKNKKAHIILKMNALEDPYMINLLYEASIAGVHIDILVRGACCLKPNQTYSKNIRLIRIVDSFLEHARVSYFYAQGEEHLYLNSADWMRRNLYRRIECGFPIYNTDIKKEILDILYIQLADNVKASYLSEETKNIRVPQKGKIVRAQKEIYAYLQQKYSI